MYVEFLAKETNWMLTSITFVHERCSDCGVGSNLNHNQLFHRITSILKKEDKLQKFLIFELTTQLPELFDNCSMRKEQNHH